MKDKFLIQFKRTNAWFYLSLFVRHACNFLWRYTTGRKYYAIARKFRLKDSIQCGNSNDQLASDGFLFVSDNSSSIQLASSISSDIVKRFPQDIKVNFANSSNPRDVSLNIINYLDSNTKLDILKYCTSDSIVHTVYNYFGFIPRLAGLFLQYNPVREFPPLGSQRFHRDSDIYKSLNIFMYISDVDKGNGRLSAYSLKQIPVLYSVLPDLDKRNSKSDIWDKYRIDEDDVLSSLPHTYPHHFTGKSGDFVWLDPVRVYHKGGYCHQKERFLLQISFYTEEMPKRAFMPNILDYLDLDPSNPDLSALLSDEVKRFMLSGFRTSNKLGFLPFINSNFVKYI